MIIIHFKVRSEAYCIYLLTFSTNKRIWLSLVCFQQMLLFHTVKMCLLSLLSNGFHNQQIALNIHFMDYETKYRLWYITWLLIQDYRALSSYYLKFDLCFIATHSLTTNRCLTYPPSFPIMYNYISLDYNNNCMKHIGESGSLDEIMNLISWSLLLSTQNSYSQLLCPSGASPFWFMIHFHHY